MRLLKLTKPTHMTGPDVLHVQQSLIARGALIDPDSDYGPQTQAAVHAFQIACGLDAPGTVGADTLARLDAPGGPKLKPPPKPAPAPQPRTGKGTPGAKAVAWLEAHKIFEGAQNNRGAQLDAWWKAYDPSLVGQPWCGLTVWMAYKQGAGIDLRDADIVFTPAATQDARTNTHHLRLIHAAQVRRGDVVLFDWGGGGQQAPASATDHIAMATGPANVAAGTVPTIEGNTSPGSAGDQSGHGGGDGVYEKVRAISLVIAFARVVPAE